MPQYVIAYHAGKKSPSPQDASAQRAKWKAWIGALGDAMVNPGTPLGKSKFVTSQGPCDSEANHLTGFSIVTAASMDAAVELAQGCPYLDYGTLEVAEIMEMK
jgi:hypothetical protein